MYGWVQAGEVNLQLLRVGCKGRDSSLFRFSLDRLTASNPRRVGQDFTRAGTPFDRWVQGERRLPRVGFKGWRYTPWSMARCRWRGKSPSPASGETAIRFDDENWVHYPDFVMTEGMQRGRAAGPLAKMCGTTTHILRSSITMIVVSAISLRGAAGFLH